MVDLTWLNLNFPARNHEHDHQFRLTINDWASASSNKGEKEAMSMNPEWLLKIQRNTAASTTVKEGLENTKYKLPGGCVIVSVSSMFWK